MTRTLVPIASLVVALAVAAPRAHAEPTVDELEASGTRHYELAEYDAAIADFKTAFRISDAPRFLFDLAQAYRLQGDCRQALPVYKTFLRRTPDAPNADKVRARIDEMTACVAKLDAAKPAGTGTTTTATTTGPPPRRHRTWKTWVGLGAIGVGAIAAGAGGLFARAGSRASDDLRTTCATDCTSADALAIERRGNAANRNATIAFVGAGVAIAAGITLVLLDRRGVAEAGPTAGPAITPTAHGAAATWTWSF